MKSSFRCPVFKEEFNELSRAGNFIRIKRRGHEKFNTFQCADPWRPSAAQQTRRRAPMVIERPAAEHAAPRAADDSQDPPACAASRVMSLNAGGASSSPRLVHRGTCDLQVPPTFLASSVMSLGVGGASRSRGIRAVRHRAPPTFAASSVMSRQEAELERPVNRECWPTGRVHSVRRIVLGARF